ncbi:ANR family transcriptional regulator [Citrobacter portucalensis]|uniref:ANR family transcriptional regulator n=1 Tax=Citrobacter portucalensis TaxID=1639133 RepID=UPI00226B5D89|nr:ANR family transcriptional regulator [Citrobacter portucalensis]MCX9038963.1 ANR family transcriptional regulator [Citrobacter portucalensis]
MQGNSLKTAAQRKYQNLAEAAARAESNGNWQLAASLWTRAENAAWGTLSKLWARGRNEYCINAANHGWVARHAVN